MTEREYWKLTLYNRTELRKQFGHTSLKDDLDYMMDAMNGKKDKAVKGTYEFDTKAELDKFIADNNLNIDDEGVSDGHVEHVFLVG